MTVLPSQIAYLKEMLRQAGLDAEAQIVAARIQTALTSEIHHRMKNMLTIVTAIVRQTMRSAANLSEAESAIGTRLIAMSKAHDLLLKVDMLSTDLYLVVDKAIAQHNTAAGRIIIQGEKLEVSSASILPISLLLNELCTNATKYGALSNDAGMVAISWVRDLEHLVVRWVETGGPAVTEPSKRSFGMRLIEDGIPRQLGGLGQLFFPATGVEFSLTVPLEKLRPVET